MAILPDEWKRVSDSGVPPFNVYTKPICKSEQDDREYRVIKLENGLEAMLVHDAKGDKAAASLDVGVGHLQDPDDMPGLAHFCEHLLFMGTELYPRENEYSEYLAKNNGHSNAFTGTTNTNYFFNVSTGALSGALARFAAFFHCPLFAPSCTSRELNAVNSEHNKNHQSDIWRMFQLNKHLSKPGHPWSKFGSGNIESLSRKAKELKKKGVLKSVPNSVSGSPTSSLATTPAVSRSASPAPSTTSSASLELEGDGGPIGREIRRRLVEWWSQQYSANRMRLCVVGKESLDELSVLVSDLFSPIQNRDVDPLPSIDDHPFGEKESGTLVSAHTIMDFHAVEISFPLAYQAPLWRRQPANFVSHFVGHEGPGSLHSYLKNKGWVTALSCGPQPLARGFAMFRITVQLTKEGFEHYKEIILTVFKYLSMMRSSEFPAWYQQEMSQLRAIRFRFQEKRSPDDYAVWVSEHMAWPLPRDQILSGPQLVEEWDQNGEQEVREILDSLRIERGRALLMAKKEEHERVQGPIEWTQEPIYSTPYRVERFSREFIAKADSLKDIKELYLPGPNEFIPTNLNVDKRAVDKPAERPTLVRSTSLSELWHKKDDRFWVPRASAILDIRTPVAFESARASAMTRLYSELVTDSLTEYSYDADLAGLTYNFASHNLGIYCTLNGYNDKLDVLAKVVFDKARNLVITPERLHVVKASVVRDWQNFFMNQPYRVSDYCVRYLTTEKQWLLNEKLTEIPSVTVEELQTHIDRLLKNVRIYGLIVGNMHKDEAIRLIETAEHSLRSSGTPNQIDERGLIPPDGVNSVWNTPAPNPNEPNSALSYYVHLGSLLEPRTRVTAALLAQILAEPAFNILRTREQLGYVVSCGQWSSPGHGEVGMRLVVQSERAPAFLEERVDAFLDEMLGTLEGMPDEEFAEHKHGLEKSWSEDPKNLREETNRYWAHIDTGYLDFYRRQINVKELHTVTREDVITLFRNRVHYSSPTRAKVAVHLKAQKPRPKRMSEAAVSAFGESLEAQGVTVDQAKWREELFAHGEPLQSDVAAYWERTLAEESSLSPEAAKELVCGLSKHAEAAPATSEYEGRLREGTVLVEDPKAYRERSRLTDLPKPVLEWGDLPHSKL
ncbi:insulin-degrading enzyme [Phanerochaete sordida]|uniref:Insulin-degrading enzyme n=1 Tax=Phanerochaete sordida TaxID=48140 RepID=A0A9P3LAL6_9APHY|nr:insulin-degrading enzyme [Phanerochaete sordida]